MPLVQAKCALAVDRHAMLAKLELERRELVRKLTSKLQVLEGSNCNAQERKADSRQIPPGERADVQMTIRDLRQTLSQYKTSDDELCGEEVISNNRRGQKVCVGGSDGVGFGSGSCRGSTRSDFNSGTFSGFGRSSFGGNSSSRRGLFGSGFDSDSSNVYKYDIPLYSLPAVSCRMPPNAEIDLFDGTFRSQSLSQPKSAPSAQKCSPEAAFLKVGMRHSCALSRADALLAKARGPRRVKAVAKLTAHGDLKAFLDEPLPECAICFKEIGQGVDLPCDCRLDYCTQCWDEWLASSWKSCRQARCPSCRRLVQVDLDAETDQLMFSCLPATASMVSDSNILQQQARRAQIRVLQRYGDAQRLGHAAPDLPKCICGGALRNFSGTELYRQLAPGMQITCNLCEDGIPPSEESMSCWTCERSSRILHPFGLHICQECFARHTLPA